jgi:hypothetical protein
MLLRTNLVSGGVLGVECLGVVTTWGAVPNSCTAPWANRHGSSPANWAQSGRRRMLNQLPSLKQARPHPRGVSHILVVLKRTSSATAAADDHRK